MKHALMILTLCMVAGAPVQSEPLNWDELRKNLEELSDNTQDFFQGWVKELGPMLNSLTDEIKDFSDYEKPEVLPNGDIIIRRKQTPDPKAPVKPSVPLEI